MLMGVNFRVVKPESPIVFAHTTFASYPTLKLIHLIKHQPIVTG
jgi:hypothetical protein